MKLAFVLVALVMVERAYSVDIVCPSLGGDVDGGCMEGVASAKGCLGDVTCDSTSKRCQDTFIVSGFETRAVSRVCVATGACTATAGTAALNFALATGKNYFLCRDGSESAADRNYATKTSSLFCHKCTGAADSACAKAQTDLASDTFTGDAATGGYGATVQCGYCSTQVVYEAYKVKTVTRDCLAVGGTKLVNDYKTYEGKGNTYEYCHDAQQCNKNVVDIAKVPMESSTAPPTPTPCPVVNVTAAPAAEGGASTFHLSSFAGLLVLALALFKLF